MVPSCRLANEDDEVYLILFCGSRAVGDGRHADKLSALVAWVLEIERKGEKEKEEKKHYPHASYELHYLRGEIKEDAGGKVLIVCIYSFLNTMQAQARANTE